MLANLLANGVLLLHLAFIVFAVFGGLLVLRRRWLAWLHVPAMLWAAAVEMAGWVCPLTPLENRLLATAGRTGYSGGFIEHYIANLIYPQGLTRDIALGAGIVLLLLNGLIYTILFYKILLQKDRP